MPVCAANGIEIACQEHGAANDPVLLMIQGLGMPLSAWPPALIDDLVAQGFRVVTFDNRDMGQSSHFDRHGLPNIPRQWLRAMLRMPVRSPYELSDMMRDAEGVLDALDIEAAHVVGISMGGMIAQLLAIHAPRKVLSLTSLMSTTGNRRLPGPKWSVARHLMSRPASASLEDRLAFGAKTWRLIGSPAYPASDERLRETLMRIYSREVPPAGIARQLNAIMAAPSRVKALRRLSVSALVIHGDADPLVPLACGRDTAVAIPGARLEIIEGMGHDLPEQLLPRLSHLIADHARSAGRQSPA